MSCEALKEKDQNKEVGIVHVLYKTFSNFNNHHYVATIGLTCFLALLLKTVPYRLLCLDRLLRISHVVLN